MRWKKLGQLFKMPYIDVDLCSHASNPLAVLLSEDVYRIFFSGRNAGNCSSVGYADINIITGEQVAICNKASVKYGPPGSFYSHGISIGNMYSNSGKDYILFMGWNILKGEHWRGDIGQLELTAPDKLRVTSDKPFMGIDEEDKVSLSYPFVLYHEGIYKMWYGSTITWKEQNGEMLHVIKYATSRDGLTWQKHGLAVPYENGVAQAFSRPIVIIDDSGYHMWYSYRSGDGTKYRIGYATSLNGSQWTRRHDLLSLNVSNSGWDSEMVCYPFVFDHKGKRYMLYNGNDFGKDGFGLAVLE